MVRHDVFKGDLAFEDVGAATNAFTFVPANLSQTEIAQCCAFASLELVVPDVLRVPQRIECYVDVDAQVLVVLRRGNNFRALGNAVDTCKQIALYVSYEVRIWENLICRVLTSYCTPQLTAVCHVQAAHTSKVSAIIGLAEVVPRSELREQLFIILHLHRLL